MKLVNCESSVKVGQVGESEESSRDTQLGKGTILGKTILGSWGIEARRGSAQAVANRLMSVQFKRNARRFESNLIALSARAEVKDRQM